MTDRMAVVVGDLTEERVDAVVNAARRDSVRNSLRRCVEQGIRTVAFPAIGTGVAGFPMERCAEIMIEEVRAHLTRERVPEQVRFALLDEAAAAPFRARLT